jgi:hypothetical protein
MKVIGLSNGGINKADRQKPPISPYFSAELGGMGKRTRLPVVFGAQKSTGNGVPLPMPPRMARHCARLFSI